VTPLEADTGRRIKITSEAIIGCFQMARIKTSACFIRNSSFYLEQLRNNLKVYGNKCINSYDAVWVTVSGKDGYHRIKRKITAFPLVKVVPQ
jgi:hypothetical protein